MSLVRRYHALFSEKALQIENITTASRSVTSSVVFSDAADGGATGANFIVASATQIVSVANAHGDVYIQNSGLRATAAGGGCWGDRFIPATRGGFSS